MTRNVLLIQGHPDAERTHFCHALEDAYCEGVASAGHSLRRICIAGLDFPLLRSQREWQHSALPQALGESQQALEWAGHVALIFPLWLGDMPALVKGFLEQVARPGFAFSPRADHPFAAGRLRGRSARIVVTMGMPASVYRWYFGAHSVRSLERNILGFVGFSPVERTLIGSVDQLQDGAGARWLARMRRLGERGQ